jgi:hypothetical protein
MDLGLASVIVGRSPVQVRVCICALGVQFGIKFTVKVIYDNCGVQEIYLLRAVFHSKFYRLHPP